MVHHYPTLDRRQFLQTGLIGMTGVAMGETIELPFENGHRLLVKYPQKRPLIRLTARPPQLETPFSVFNESLLTPNDAFFVRYHLGGAPPPASVLDTTVFRLTVSGSVLRSLTFSLDELKARFETVETVAVNQCSGNSRGYFTPRVPGGQLGHGAMGCARWTGVRLADLLKAAELSVGAKQVVFDGMDRPLLAGIPDFVKALSLDQALNSDALLAWAMNGEALPWLNGFPLRLVLPGHYGTYWVKHLHSIRVVDEEFKGFWMSPAYRIPEDPCAHVLPGTPPGRTIPISRFNVRSFLTSHLEGQTIRSGQESILRGMAFDGGSGIHEVLVSTDEGGSWRGAELGRDFGRFAFREWTLAWRPKGANSCSVRVRAMNRLGESQPLEPLWNPAGYMRNVVEKTSLKLI